eukprot:1290443-Amphidinium_carterae.1
MEEDCNKNVESTSSPGSVSWMSGDMDDGCEVLTVLVARDELVHCVRAESPSCLSVTKRAAIRFFEMLNVNTLG